MLPDDNYTEPWLALLVYPLALFIFLAVSWPYFALFESSRFMATPGKMVFKIKVSDMEGYRISFAKATIRYIIKLALFDLIGFFIPILSCVGALYFLGNALSMYTNDERQCFHDRIAGTIVTGYH